MDRIRFGALDIGLSEAENLVTQYTGTTTARKPYSYPYYDGFDTGTTDTLVDGDFLAPALLNAPVSIAAFAGLQARRGELDVALEAIPLEVDLANASDAQIELLGPLFSVLDGPGIYGVQGVILSKILHRKRPQFVPLFDDKLLYCYQGAAGAPVDRVRGRDWSAFVVVLARAMRHDLHSQLASWSRLCSLVPRSQPISALRCLDIVAWSTADHSLPEGT